MEGKNCHSSIWCIILANYSDNNVVEKNSILYIGASSVERWVYIGIQNDRGVTNGDLTLRNAGFSVVGFDSASAGVDERTGYSTKMSASLRVTEIGGEDASKVSLTIVGTGFYEGMSAVMTPVFDSRWDQDLYMTLNGRTTLTPTIDVTSPTKAILTFDEPINATTFNVYAGVSPLRQYNLSVNGSELFVTASDIYETYKPGSNFPTASVSIPDSIRAGRVYEGTLRYSGALTDVTAPLFVLTANDGVQLSLTQDFTDATNTLQALGIGTSGDAGTLRPNDSGEIKFYFKADSAVDIRLGRLRYGAAEECDDTTYFATWKEYHEALAQASTRLNKRGKTTYSVEDAFALAALTKEGKDVAAISGVLRDSRDAEPIAGATLVAQWTDADGKSKARYAETDENGWFSLAYLPENTTFTLLTLDASNLSQTTFQLGAGDLNGVRLTGTAEDKAYERAVAVDGSLVASIVYKPSELTNNRAAQATLVVKNTSQVPVDPALMLVSAVDGSGERNALLTLDPTKGGVGYYASVMPDGFASSLQVLVCGDGMSALQPGETIEIPIYWGGWLKPWDETNFELQVGFMKEVASEELDLAALETETRSGIEASNGPLTDAQWSIIWGRLSASIGTTWGSYAAALSEIAQELAASGRTVRDASSLTQVATSQALDAFSPFATPTSSTDNYVGSSSFGLSFSRVYVGGSILGRFDDSTLGFGWKSGWDYAASLDEDGNVAISSPTGLVRTFQADRTVAQELRYRATTTDDLGKLVRRADGNYALTEVDGTVYVFASTGELLRFTDSDGNEIALSYDAKKRLTGVADEYGCALSLAYNAAGKLATVVDNNGDKTTYEYDETGAYLTKATWSDGRSIEYVYSDATDGALLGTMIAIRYADGTCETFEYDEIGRLVGVVGSDGSSAAIEWVGALTYKIYDGGEFQGTVYLDENGSTLRSIDALNRLTTYGYDDYGRVVSATDSLGNVSTYVYDERGDVVESVDANGVKTSFTYDERSLPTSFVDGNGAVVRFTYDANGRMTLWTRADGASSSAAYNDDGTISSETDRAGATTDYVYDERGNLTSVSLSTESAATTYVYDERGNVLQIVDPSGGVTETTYDAHDRVTKIVYPNGRYLTYSYDALGRQTSVSDGGSYYVGYAYDEQGRLAQVLDKNGVATTVYGYDALGRLATETAANGATTRYAYDALSRLTSKTTTVDGSLVASFGYEYDARDLVATLTALDGVWSYEYDATGQLTLSVFDAADGSGLSDRRAEYRYDASGNRVWASVDGVETNYKYDVANRLISDGAYVYSYDANGNLTLKTNVATGETLSYLWNQRGQMVACVASTGERWDYEYDVFGARTATIKTDAAGNVERTEYLVDPNSAYGDIVAQFDGDGNLVANYIYGLALVAQVDGSGAAAYYASDVLGSTAALTDADGNAVNRYVYDECGGTLSATETVETPFQFVGTYGVVTGDSAELTQMRARWYDPATARFVSEDPIGYAAGDVNLYRYCWNGCANLVDISGLFGEYTHNAKSLGKFNSTSGVSGASGYSFGDLSNRNSNARKYNGSLGSRLNIDGTYDSGSLNKRGQGWNTANSNNGLSPDEVKKALKGSKNNPFQNRWSEKEAEKALKEGKNNPFKNVKSPSRKAQQKVLGALGKSLAKNGAKIGARHLILGNVNPVIQAGLLVWDIYDLTKDLLEILGGDESENPQSCDPNEIVGPIGFDFVAVDANEGVEGADPFLVITSPNWTNASTDESRDFRIYFENKATATAAAQEVFVTTALPLGVDLASFRLGEVCIGGQIYSATVGSVDGVWTVAQKSTGDQIQIRVDYDPTSGEARWYLRSYVESTADHFPSDPYAGFLPPNDATVGNGEGYVSFSVEYDANLTTGTVLETNAVIVFDANEAIVTNTWLNTIDADAPTVEVVSTEYDETSRTIAVEWSGADVGSGIACYDAYYSTDGGKTFELWASQTVETSGLFTIPAIGSEYVFQVVAFDAVGNASSGATASISVESEDLIRWSDSVYVVSEDCALSLSAEGSTGDELTYYWDLTGSQTVDASNFTEGAATIWTSPEALGFGPGEYEIRLRTRDKSGIYSGIATATLRVEAAAPTIDVASQTLGDGSVLRLDLTATGCNAPIATWRIDWGDGGVSTFDSLGTALTAARVYDAAEEARSYVVTLTCVDANGRGADVVYELATHTVPAATADAASVATLETVDFADVATASAVSISTLETSEAGNALETADAVSVATLETVDFADFATAFEPSGFVAAVADGSRFDAPEVGDYRLSTPRARSERERKADVFADVAFAETLDAEEVAFDWAFADESADGKKRSRFETLESVDVFALDLSELDF